ncbi:MAG: hypothetical protein OXG68_04905 [Chloroflexi bacterium]|nr:hypothetical protein [Chloroflexota bacterium]
MPAEDKNQRYENILKNIERRHPFGSTRKEANLQTPQDRVLNLLNAFDALAELAQRDFERLLCYGPQTVRGRAWSGVVIWHHSKGYHGYQTLRLLGVWAHYREGEIMLSIGIRRLPYRAPVYDAGVYRVAIQNNFRLYYDDDGHPPADGDRLLYRAPFKLRERLEHRQALTDMLHSWISEIEAR